MNTNTIVFSSELENKEDKHQG